MTELPATAKEVASTAEPASASATTVGPSVDGGGMVLPDMPSAVASGTLS